MVRDTWWSRSGSAPETRTLPGHRSAPTRCMNGGTEDRGQEGSDGRHTYAIRVFELAKLGAMIEHADAAASPESEGLPTRSGSSRYPPSWCLRSMVLRFNTIRSLSTRAPAKRISDIR
jgi:hypothetical protein